MFWAVWLLILPLLSAVAGPPRQVGAQEPVPARTDTASYDMQARYDPATHQIQGTETIAYRNPSNDTLNEVWFKLYLNAFRSPDTAWMRDARSAGRDDRYSADNPGWIRIERLTLAETGESILPADAATAETVLRVPLPRPLPPGQMARLEVAWTSQLPRVFLRTGFAGDFILAGQWYPKLAVYDRGAWDAEPWRSNSEFFADFGTYSLTLTVPTGHVTGATGLRESSLENGDGTTTVRYRAERVSDVAWTAWPGFRVVQRTVRAAGREVEVELLTPREYDFVDDRYINTAGYALDWFGRRFGAYPWQRLTIVVPPEEGSAADAMEYPMFVTVGRPTRAPLGVSESIRQIEGTTIHEVAHQWIPLQVATNEGREAWLDEGFADYGTIRVLAELYGPCCSMADVGPVNVGYGPFRRLLFTSIAPRLPLALPSWEYADASAYAATVYSKGALALLTLERTLGEERFTAAFGGFFERWRWRHPTSADLEAALEDGSGERLAWFFRAFVFGTGVVEYRLASADDQGAVVERRGDVAFPVVVRLTYADGRVEDRTWDGGSERYEAQAQGGRLTRVEVDPERRIALELNPLDNGLVVRADRGPATALAGRALAVLQTVLRLLGTIG